MSSTDKLLEKLKNGSITGSELQTLLGRLGWRYKEGKGSHRMWIGPNGKGRVGVVKERETLKRYQIEEAQKALIPQEEKKNEEPEKK